MRTQSGALGARWHTVPMLAADLRQGQRFVTVGIEGVLQLAGDGDAPRGGLRLTIGDDRLVLCRHESGALLWLSLGAKVYMQRPEVQYE